MMESQLQYRLRKLRNRRHHMRRKRYRRRKNVEIYPPKFEIRTYEETDEEY